MKPCGLEGFWTIWFGHHPYLYKICLRSLAGNTSMADDAMSIAFLKAYLKFRGSESTIRNLRYWLGILVRNTCIDMYRRERRLVEAKFGTIQEESYGLEQAFPSPEELLIAAQLNDQLVTAMTKLPDGLYRAFMLRVIKEKSYREVSSELQISVPNARKRVQLARQMIHRRVNKSSTNIGPM